MGVGFILGGQITSLAADTGTWPNSSWSPSKLAKVAAWEQAQLEDARKKPNRRTLRQFDKRTHRRTTSTSSSTSDAALQPPKLYILSGQSAAEFVMDMGLILRGQSTSVAADAWPIKHSSWSPPLLAKVAAWEQAQLEAARIRRNRRTIAARRCACPQLTAARVRRSPLHVSAAHRCPCPPILPALLRCSDGGDGQRETAAADRGRRRQWTEGDSGCSATVFKAAAAAVPRCSSLLCQSEARCSATARVF